ncbi:HIT domain-containing protein [Psychromonas sp. Urea-02u-13]|uniref:HIT domain-containing protein n=1 Tax=Psychromonas sp. Urea-02u-13 TaxID=2058326 RepID=UPI000C338586|nr:HIT domain-containing protein [Psychromonas sp. Urea-02u-13]PKG39149.1 HIT family protein [Psychromonas sp. Urea-02u-13]
MTFTLDARLNNDCFTLAETPTSVWLLLNNSHFPWFIIVPKTQIEELYLLPLPLQAELQQQSAFMSEFVATQLPCDKLNVAAIGNIVKQMHLHIIGRTETDLCWPGVVWGTEHKMAYEKPEVLAIQAKLQSFCKQKVINSVEFASLQ